MLKWYDFLLFYTAQFHYCVGGGMPPPYDSISLTLLNNHLSRYWETVCVGGLGKEERRAGWLAVYFLG